VGQARPGADRTDVEYAWPQRLLRPPPDVPIVYIDLNHWIGLTKAATGHPDGNRHLPALEALRTRAQEIVIPLAAPLYMEMAGIRDPRQRFEIAAVMEELSAFRCLMTGPEVTTLELDAAVARIAGTRERFGPLPLIGTGALQAFGKVGGLRVRSADGGDVTEEARRQWRGGPEAFDVFQAEAELTLDRAVLRGPTDAEVPQLQALGWDPTSAKRTAENRAEQQREHARTLDEDPRWRRGRLRDVVAARYIALEVYEGFNRVLTEHDLQLSDIASGPDGMRRFTDSMPSADAWITLHTAAHRNATSRWTPNDIFDIDALCFAAPYCTIVLTERHATHVLQTADLPARTGTTVVATPEELVAALACRDAT
jgi:hypothetical protein